MRMLLGDQLRNWTAPSIIGYYIDSMVPLRDECHYRSNGAGRADSTLLIAAVSAAAACKSAASMSAHWLCARAATSSAISSPGRDRLRWLLPSALVASAAAAALAARSRRDVVGARCGLGR